MYICKQDIIEPLADGSGVKLLFPTGAAITWATARALGLVEGDEPPLEPKKGASNAQRAA